MERILNTEGAALWIPWEVAETLKDDGYQLLEEISKENFRGKIVLTSIQYSTGVWLWIYKNGFGRPEWLEYYPRESKEPTKFYRIRKLYKPITL